MSARFWRLVFRALRLRCPFCGEGKLFIGPFRMNERCPHCNTKLEREPGFYLGSIYFNYGLTALISAIVYPILLINKVLPERQLQWIVMAFVIVFPLWFFRYARSLWLGFDQFADPRPGTEEKQAEP